MSAASALPFGMAPAPKRLRSISDPIDLGKYSEEFAGWCVVIDLGVDLEVNEIIATATDTTLGMRERNQAVATWVEKALVAWNFVDTEGEPLPQPREGGAIRTPQAAIEPISMALAEQLTPKKS